MKTIRVFLIMMLLGTFGLIPPPAWPEEQAPAEVTDGLARVARWNKAGDFKQALAAVKALRQRYPDNKQVLFDCLATMAWAGHYQEAADLAAHLAGLSPPDYVLAAAAQSLRHSGRPEEAEAFYLEGERRFPGRTDFVLGLALTLTDENRFNEARYVLLHLKSRAPSGLLEAQIAEAESYLINREKRARAASLETSREEAAELARQGQYEEALNRLSRLKAENPDNEAISFDYLTILSWAGWHPEAVALSENLNPDRYPPYVIEAAARSYRETGQYAKAEELFSLGLAKNPDEPGLLAGLELTRRRQGGLDETEAGQRRQTAADAPRAEVLNKPSAATAGEQRYLRANREKAVALAQAGDYRQALASLEALREERPDDQALLADYLTVLNWAGRHARAAGLADQLALEEAPEYAVAAAASSLRKSGRLLKAQTWCEEALKRFPDNLDLNLNYALTLGERGRLSPALAHLDTYSRQHPETGRSQLNEARLYLRKRRADQPAYSPPPRPPAPYREEQDQAVDLARRGRLDESLAIMARLHGEYQGDQYLLADYLTILTWGRNYVRALELAPLLNLEQAPAYAVEAVAEALVATGDYHQAHNYVEQAVRRQRRNPELLISGALSLARTGDYVQAAAYLEEAGQSRQPGLGNRLEAAKKTVGYDRIKAMSDLSKANRALKRNPRDRQALRLKVLALSGVGAGRLAWDLNEPDLNLSEEQLRDLAMSAGLQEAYADEVPGPIRSINQRYRQYHGALASLDRLRIDPACAAAAPCRAWVRQARLRPLMELNRLAELVDEYETLKEESPQLLPAAELSAAGAYLALRQPVRAGRIYREVMERRQTDPNLTDDDLYEAQKGLFWSLLEAEQLSGARARAEENYETRRPQDNSPAWLSRDETVVDAYATLGWALLYTGFLAKGEKHFQEMAAGDPKNVEALSGLAMSQALRERPRAALDIIHQALNLEPDNIGLMIQEANALMEAGKWRQAHEIIKTLEPYAPYSTAVQQLQRSWKTHNMFVAQVSLSWSDTKSNNPSAYTPDQAPVLEALLYTPPIKYNWRLYAGTALESGKFEEGRARQEMVIGGLEYRGPLLEVSLEGRTAKLNHNQRTGGGISGELTPGDHWRFPFALQRKSRNTPLRAMYNGVFADEYMMGAAYHWNEGRSLEASGSYMDFSDGNKRLAVSGLFSERLLSRYNHTLDGRLSLYASHNSQDDDRLYYNPKDDFSYSAGLTYTGPIRRHYDKYLSHALSVDIGGYNQKNHGSGLIWNLDYHHNLDWTDRFAATYGAGYGRNIYDGEAEKNLNLYLTVVWRF